MTSEPSTTPPERQETPASESEQCRHLDSYWEALERGETTGPEAWTGTQAGERANLADLRVLRALHDAREMVREDSQIEPALAERDPGEQTSAPPRRLLPTGTRLGPCRVKICLGYGGMGEVYLAEHQFMHKLVALKVLPAVLSDDSERVTRFLQEVQVVARPNPHPHLAAAFHAGEDKGRYYLVMEYVSGFTLKQYVERNGPLGVAEACEIVRQMAEGLDYLHGHGIVHRDFKPSNMILTPDGQVKILDLGLGRVTRGEGMLGEGSLTPSGALLGTLDYLAPEQARDASAADRRSDLYSLGCTFYFLLTGRPPFADYVGTDKLAAHARDLPPPFERFRQDVTDAIDATVKKLMAKQPDDRYPTARTLIKDLEKLTDPNPGNDQPSWPPPKEVWLYLPTPGSSTFVGRDNELSLLDEAWKDDSCHLITIVGGWGKGKSALVHAWLQRMEADNYRGAEWVLGWSFRGQGGEENVAGDDFFRRALLCLNDPNSDHGLEQEKAIRLTRLIRAHRTLLVLDGLEPFQTPSTTREEGGKLTNEALRGLILNLAHQINGLCILTSRLPVWDLPDQVCGGQRGRVGRIDLPTLGLDPAKELLKSRNLHGSEEEFDNAVQTYQQNPLSLSLLASLLLRCHQGNIARWTQVDRCEETLSPILDSLQPSLGQEGEAVMKLMGLFEGPAPAEVIRALRARPPIPGLTDVLSCLDENAWKAVMANLRAMQLLTEANPQRPGDLDCHPMVRAYFAKRLKCYEPEAWRQGHLRLYQHFKKEENPGNIDDLYLAIHHGCEAGEHQEVFEKLIWEKMAAGYVLKRVNAYGAGARDELTLRYFVNVLDSEPQCDKAGFDGERKGRLFLWAAVVLHVLGHVQRAIEFAKSAIKAFDDNPDRSGCLCASAYLSWFLAANGQLKEAIQLSKECMDRADEYRSKHPVWERLVQALHACLLAYGGEKEDSQQALILFEKAMTAKCPGSDDYEVVLAILRFHYACLLLQCRKSSQAVKEEADTLIQLGKTNPTLGFLGNQILVRMELAEATEYEREGKKAEKEGCLDRAGKHFDEGQPYLNLGPAHDLTIVNSLFMARFCRLSGYLTGAAEHLKRAKDAVGDYALLNLDCKLESAWLCLAEKDRVKASEYFKEVSNLVEQIGYHCIDRELEYLEKELGKA